MKKSLLLLWISLLCSILQANDRLSFRNFDVNPAYPITTYTPFCATHMVSCGLPPLNRLNRYDGYPFKKSTTPQPEAYNNDIESVTEDAASTIWIKGPVSYYIYNRESDKIENKIQPVLNKYGITGEAEYLTVDPEHNLQCTAEGTLYYYDFKQEALCRLPLPGDKKIKIV